MTARRMVSSGLETQIVTLAQLNLKKRLIELLFFPLLWAFGATLTMMGPRAEPSWLHISLRAAGIGISAIALNAFVLLLHEGMHGVLFRNRAANRWGSVALGCCVLISYSAYQVMHLRHHQFLGDPRDPDDYDNYTRSPRTVWMLHFVRLTVGALLYILMIPILSLRCGRALERRRILAEYGILLTIWSGVLVFVPWNYLLNCWALPVLLVACMTNIRGFSQHGIAEASDPFLASRSMHPNRIVSFLLLHENLHLEHHLFPEIPSYHLAKLHDLISPRFPRAVTGKSYLAFIAKFILLTFQSQPRPIIGLTAVPALRPRNGRVQ